MKLVSAKQKNTISDPLERINFSNEIELVTVTGNTTFRLSDFTSDIIRFRMNTTSQDISLVLFCDRNLRKYTFIVDNLVNKQAVVYLGFVNDKGEEMTVDTNTDTFVKAGTSGVIDLYQTAVGLIHLVVHHLSLIEI